MIAFDIRIFTTFKMDIMVYSCVIQRKIKKTNSNTLNLFKAWMPSRILCFVFKQTVIKAFSWGLPWAVNALMED